MAKSVSTTSTTTAAGSPADELRAQHQTLRQNDLPKGWESSAYTGATGGGGTGLEGPMAAGCLGVPLSVMSTTPPSADSPYFDSPNGTREIQENVEIFPNVAATRADFAAFTSASAPRCMVELLQATYAQEIDVDGRMLGTIAATAVPMAHLGVAAADIRLTFPVTKASKTTTTYLDLVDVTRGRSEATIDMTGVGAPIPAVLRVAIARKAAQRLR